MLKEINTEILRAQFVLSFFHARQYLCSFANKPFRQIVGISEGTNYAPLILFTTGEFPFIIKLHKYPSKRTLISLFNNNWRFL